ncbi:MAG: YggT family protein [Microbacteriaceae bacterium]|nr:YggT family protein [Microbacteriaceae bacterium]
MLIGLSWALSIYLVVLFARIVFELVQAIARGWRPRGFLLVLAEIVYTLTDPPVKLVRRFVPPLRIGPVALDLSVLIIWFAIVILQTLLGLVRVAV